MTNSNRFLSCDWGTSSFRLRLVDSVSFEVIAEQVSKQGNAETFKKWKDTGKQENERLAFYLNILRDQILKLEKAAGKSLSGLTLIISGMASSTIGMLELPYGMIPFKVDGSDLITQVIDNGGSLENEIILISGVKSNDDVMRGEETQLVGCMLTDDPEEQLFIHPGTHSKHIFIRNGDAVALKTYMTGELFSLLSKHSILAGSIEEGACLDENSNREHFEQGLNDISEGNLLHDLFRVRTNDLFKKLTLQENRFYLSALLIGSELKALQEKFTGKITLAGEDVLVEHYHNALQIMGITKKISGLSIMNATEITVRGQFQVFRLRQNISPGNSNS